MQKYAGSPDCFRRLLQARKGMVIEPQKWEKERAGKSTRLFNCPKGMGANVPRGGAASKKELRL